MKTFIKIALCALLVLSTSCKKKTKAADGEEGVGAVMNTKDSEVSSSAKFEQADDCDEFIDQYESWMEEYLELLEKYKDNPMDLVSAPEYTQMTSQAAEWASNWSVKLTTSCAANAGYEKRMRKIQEKADQKLKEIGLRK